MCIHIFWSSVSIFVEKKLKINKKIGTVFSEKFHRIRVEVFLKIIKFKNDWKLKEKKMKFRVWTNFKKLGRNLETFWRNFAEIKKNIEEIKKILRNL